MSLFTPIVSVLPEGSHGAAQVKHFRVTPKEASYSRMRQAITGGREEGVSEGDYCQLLVNGQLMMSDTQMEHQTNYEVVKKSRGRVLISGLGIGMILIPILAKPEVTKVTILEKYQDVIDLVSPHFQDPRLEIICADVFDYKPPKGSKWDTIYHDIWPDQSTDDLADMSKLHRKYGRYLASGGWQESWRRGLLKAQLLRRKKNSRYAW